MVYLSKVKNMNKKKVIKWFILILWLGIIFAFSHQANSGEFTKNIIADTIEVKVETDTNDFLDIINFIARKGAHISEYIVLTLIIFSLAREYTEDEKKIIVIGLIGCIIFAAGDEFHQYFVPGRSALVTDVLIDFIGAIIALIIYKIILKYKPLINKNKQIESPA